MNTIGRLVGNKSRSESTEIPSIVILQRKAHRFSEEELQVAAEGGWEKRFDGKKAGRTEMTDREGYSCGLSPIFRSSW